MNSKKKKKFYYREWHEAQKDGNTRYANECKEQYRKLVMQEKIKPYHFYSDKLKMFPILNLN